MRNKVALVLLVTSVFIWGIWCGGQVFNELMTVPKWSASPPESLKAYDALPSKGGQPFFPLFNPLFVVLAIGAAIAAWKSARRSKVWLALSVGTSLVVLLSLIFILCRLSQVCSGTASRAICRPPTLLPVSSSGRLAIEFA